MAEKTIEQRVKEIIVEQLGVNADQVTNDDPVCDTSSVIVFAP